MLNCKRFFHLLYDKNITFFTGVPDSLLKDLCACISDNVRVENHITSANEGNAIALASGYHMSTGKIALVYMQNSGLGNAINPLTSLTNASVSSIPMLLLIGWRGQPGARDEPQHQLQGSITPKLLELLGIPYRVLSKQHEAVEDTLSQALSDIKKTQTPYALLVQKNTFYPYEGNYHISRKYPLSRTTAIHQILTQVNFDDIIITSTGKISREVYACREDLKQPHDSDFLTVGAMGHCSQIALGMALQHKRKKFYCLDGDGALIMHLGGMGTIGTSSVENYCHILLNNGAHDSVGGQATVGFDIDCAAVARACGYSRVLCIETLSDLQNALAQFQQNPELTFIEIRLNKASSKTLGRPARSPCENKCAVMRQMVT